MQPGVLYWNLSSSNQLIISMKLLDFITLNLSGSKILLG